MSLKQAQELLKVAVAAAQIGPEQGKALRELSNATIERCAQEIEGRYFKHINDAAAAIRKLKDK